MKSFKEMAAQGDVLFLRVTEIPKEATRTKTWWWHTVNLVVAHSETGHHHAFDTGASVFLYSTKDALVSYLEAKKPAVLNHLREFDTHEQLLFDVGKYEIRRQRERSPEGWKRVED